LPGLVNFHPTGVIQRVLCPAVKRINGLINPAYSLIVRAPVDTAAIGYVYFQPSLGFQACWFVFREFQQTPAGVVALMVQVQRHWISTQAEVKLMREIYLLVIFESFGDL
jgi:hypothetical protein